MIETVYFALKFLLVFTIVILIIVFAIFIYAACHISSDNDFYESLKELEDEEEINDKLNSK